jgi:hypothetical protein
MAHDISPVYRIIIDTGGQITSKILQAAPEPR